MAFLSEACSHLIQLNTVDLGDQFCREWVTKSESVITIWWFTLIENSPHFQNWCNEIVSITNICNFPETIQKFHKMSILMKILSFSCYQRSANHILLRRVWNWSQDYFPGTTNDFSAVNWKGKSDNFCDTMSIFSYWNIPSKLQIP